MALVERERIDGARLRERRLAVAGEPGRLGARRVHVAEPLEVAARPRQRERLVERLGDAGIAAPRAQAAERDGRGDPDRRRGLARSIAAGERGAPPAHRPRYTSTAASHARV